MHLPYVSHLNNKTMKKYKVEITETLKKIVEVEAESAQAARQIVKDRYHDTEDDYILTDANYYDTEFEVLL